jgi:hypothetical protein
MRWNPRWPSSHPKAGRDGWAIATNDDGDHDLDLQCVCDCKSTDSFKLFVGYYRVVAECQNCGATAEIYNG